MTRALLGIPLLLLGSAAAFAAPTAADVIKARIASYRGLGASLKAANDAIRSGDARSARLQQSAAQIVAASRRQYTLFPRGSGAAAGVKTAARPEIWTRPGEFKSAQDAFARQAAVFEKAVAAGDAGVVRSEARKLGAQCKGCHDAFRVAND